MNKEDGNEFRSRGFLIFCTASFEVCDLVLSWRRRGIFLLINAGYGNLVFHSFCEAVRSRHQM